jgi:prolipoprotein diacylglyceryl transferase
MYPRISDFINEILGTDLILPIQTFGFFVAMAFVVAYFIFRADLIRKTAAGIFQTHPVEVETNGPVKPGEVLLNFLLFGLVGYKGGLMIENYTAFSMDPQGAILSAKGSLLWALVFGLVGGGWKMIEYVRKKDFKPVKVVEQHGIVEEIGTIFTIAFITGMIGAKLFHNLEYWDQFISDPIGSLLSFDGLTFYGGLIVAALSIMYYVRKKNQPILPIWDSASMILILGYGIGRMGCHFAGDGDWGIVNTATRPGWLSWLPDWAWAYRYPHNVLHEGVPIPGCEGEYCFQLPEAVFPTPVYEILMAFLIFGILWMLRKRLPFAGQLTAIYFVLNGIERFLIEKIRVNSTYHIFGADITQAEIISSLLVIGGIVLFILTTYKWKQPNKIPGKPAA